MRRAARIDDNQPAIVAALRRAGASVQHLHKVGEGCPDILVGHAGRNLALELKDGRKPPSDRRLTPAEQEWHAAWRGQVATVYSIDDALRVVFGIVEVAQ